MSYQELRGQIRAKFKTQEDFARAINISVCSVSKKLNGKTEWTAEEISTICKVLGINPSEIPRYFFYFES